MSSARTSGKKSVKSSGSGKQRWSSTRKAAARAERHASKHRAPAHPQQSRRNSEPARPAAEPAPEARSRRRPTGEESRRRPAADTRTSHETRPTTSHAPVTRKAAATRQSPTTTRTWQPAAPTPIHSPVRKHALEAASHAAERTSTRRPADPSASGFTALGLPYSVVERLARDGIVDPFPIQQAAIPDALAGRDVLGRGQTGSGKTLAFGLPVLVRLAADGSPTRRRPRALILVPTRELAMQVSDALAPLVHLLGLKHKLIAGGMPYQPQLDALDRGVDLLIATPGRMNDLVERGAAILDAVEIAVLDEADHMADMGFLPEVTALLDLLPATGQRLLFSATLDRGIDVLVERYLTDPVTHRTDPSTASVTTMVHHILLIDPMHRKALTAQLTSRPGRTLVFVRTKLGADRVASQLREQGVLAAAIHGGLGQSQRNKVLAAFRDGRVPVLVATDVAARGIHVDDVSVVVQADPPADHKDYLHRSGRTARAGDVGTVVTLTLPHQRAGMTRLAAQAGLDVRPTRAVPGDDALRAAVGATEPSGVPVLQKDFDRLIDGEPKRRRAGGYRRPGRPRRRD